MAAPHFHKRKHRFHKWEHRLCLHRREHGPEWCQRCGASRTKSACPGSSIAQVSTGHSVASA
eukprot:2050720-Rhodomonas_salina.1